MSFGGEIHDRIEGVGFEEFLNLHLFGNVSANELVSRIAGHFLQVPKVPGIGQQVVVDDTDVFASSQDIANEVGTDEAGAARNEDFHNYVWVTL